MRTFWTALLFAFVMSATATGQSPCDSPLHWGECKPSHSGNEKNAPANAQRGTTEQPLVVEVIRPQAEQDKAAHEDKAEHEKAHREQQLVDATWGLVLVTGLLVVGTGILAVFTYRLWDDARGTSKRQGAEMRRSLAFSARATRAATQQVKIAEETAERQLRAYVMTGAFDVEGIADGKTPSVTIELKNSGQSPARHMTSRLDIALLENPPPVSKFTLKGIETNSRSPVAPGGSYAVTVFLDRPISDQDIIVLKGGRWALYVWGQIDYIDAFDKPRWTTFRAVFGKQQIAEEPYHMGVCEDGNDIH